MSSKKLARNVLKKTPKVPHTSKVKAKEKKKKNTKLFGICSVLSHTSISHLVATNQLNCNKSHTTAFHKTRDTRAGNLRTESSNKSQ